MSKTRYFEATRSDGTVLKRASKTRVYTHAVAIWCDGTKAWWTKEAGWYNTEWAGRRDLAVKNANSWNGKPGFQAYVLDVREVPKPSKQAEATGRNAKPFVEAASKANRERLADEGVEVIEDICKGQY